MKPRDDFKTYKLSEINELSLLMLICKPKMEHDIKMRLGFCGGRVLLSLPAKGVSRKPILEILGVISVDMQVIFSVVRREDASSIMEKIGTEFELSKPGNGKAFLIDVDGYLGAKGPMVEV